MSYGNVVGLSYDSHVCSKQVWTARELCETFYSPESTRPNIADNLLHQSILTFTNPSSISHFSSYFILLYYMHIWNVNNSDNLFTQLFCMYMLIASMFSFFSLWMHMDFAKSRFLTFHLSFLCAYSRWLHTPLHNYFFIIQNFANMHH